MTSGSQPNAPRGAPRQPHSPEQGRSGVPGCLPGSQARRIALRVETARGETLTFPNYSPGELAAALRIACAQSLRSPATEVWQGAERIARYENGYVRGTDTALRHYELVCASEYVTRRERNTAAFIAEGANSIWAVKPWMREPPSWLHGEEEERYDDEW